MQICKILRSNNLIAQSLWFKSDDPQDAIYLLNEYKKTAASISEQRNKRSQQLSALSLPTGRTSPKGGSEVDEESLFNQFAAEFAKQR